MTTCQGTVLYNCSFGETIFSVISPLYAVNWHMTLSFLSILPDGSQRIFIWVMFIWFWFMTTLKCRYYYCFLSEMGYQRLSNIRKLVQDSTGCPVRTKTKKNLRCGKSSLEKWNSLLEVSQSVVEARLKPRDWLPDLLSPHCHLLCMTDAWYSAWQVLREYAFLITIGNRALRQRGQTHETWPFKVTGFSFRGTILAPQAGNIRWSILTVTLMDLFVWRSI